MTVEEFVDIFDDDMNWLGVVTRDEAHAEGYWHQTFDCWVLYREGDKQYLLFQKRHHSKKEYPSKYDTTVAGHMLAGEKVIDGVREIEEEIGVSVSFNQLISVGTVKEELQLENGRVDREICHIFLYESDLPIEQYQLQPDEVSGLIKIEIRDALRLFTDEAERAHATGYQRDNGLYTLIDTYVSFDHFVPHERHYFVTVFEAAMTYFNKKSVRF